MKKLFAITLIVLLLVSMINIYVIVETYDDFMDIEDSCGNISTLIFDGMTYHEQNAHYVIFICGYYITCI